MGVAADLFRYFAGWATKMEGTTIPIEGADLPQGGDASAAGLLARHDAVAPRCWRRCATSTAGERGTTGSSTPSATLRRAS